MNIPVIPEAKTKYPKLKRFFWKAFNKDGSMTISKVANKVEVREDKPTNIQNVINIIVE